MHAPAVHVWFALHGVPSGEGACVHLPVAQPGVLHSGAVQASAQEPQWLASEVRSTSQPLASSPSQSSHPDLQLWIEHSPAWQLVLA
jgi:hypothetical protein